VGHFGVTYITAMLDCFLGNKDEEICSNIFLHFLASGSSIVMHEFLSKQHCFFSFSGWHKL